MPAELRLGRQVVSWGESTFIQGGLNAGQPLRRLGAARAGLGAASKRCCRMNGGLQPAAHQELSTQLAVSVRLARDQAGARRAPTSAPTTSAGAGRQPRDPRLRRDLRPGRRLPLPRRRRHHRLPDHPAPGGSHSRPSRGQYGVNFKFYLPDFGQGTELGFVLPQLHQPPAGGLAADRHRRPGSAMPSARPTQSARRPRRVAAGLPLAAAIATGAAVGQQAAVQLGRQPERRPPRSSTPPSARTR